jgi:hypothetical protein
MLVVQNLGAWASLKRGECNRLQRRRATIVPRAPDGWQLAHRTARRKTPACPLLEAFAVLRRPSQPKTRQASSMAAVALTLSVISARAARGNTARAASRPMT